MEEKNPFLESEDYFKQYQDNISKLRNDPNTIEFDKLTFEIFERNEMGKKWLEMCKERYVIPALAARGTPTYQIDVLWGEGFKDFIRLILMSLSSHQQRIISGK